MKLYVLAPLEPHSAPILVCDEAHNDIAEFFHNEQATVGQSYEMALGLANQLVAGAAEMERQLQSYKERTELQAEMINRRDERIAELELKLAGDFR